MVQCFIKLLVELTDTTLHAEITLCLHLVDNKLQLHWEHIKVSR